MDSTSVAAQARRTAWRGLKALVLASAFVCAGCGQKGPLTLPAAAAAASSANR